MQNTKAYEPGDFIVKQGEASQGFCILKSGTLEVVKGSKVITELDVPGTIFGEMSDILGEPRVSDVRAKDEALVMHIEKSIDDLIVQDPGIAKKLIYTIAKRLEQTTSMLEHLLPDTDVLSEDHELEILVVDNRESMIEQIERDLANRPWKITSAESAGKAIEMAKRGNFALIILSLNLQNSADGLDFYRALRKNSRTRSVPVLATVIGTDKEMKQRGRNAGIEHLLEKPAEPRQVESAIMSALNLDTTGLYCTITEMVLHIRFPEDCSDFDKTEIVSSSPHGINGAIDSGIRKSIIDIHQVANFDESYKKPVDNLINIVSGAKLQFAVVATDEQAEELNKDRPEGKELPIHSSVSQALQSIGREDAGEDPTETTEEHSAEPDNIADETPAETPGEEAGEEISGDETIAATPDKDVQEPQG